MRVWQVRRRAPTLTVFGVMFWWTGVRFLIRVWFVLAHRARFFGAAHVPAEGPVVYVANHQSHYDPPAIGVLVGDRPYCALAKPSLFSFKPFGWAFRSMGAIRLRLGGSDAEAIRAGIGVLQRGGAVLIFPEGTRTPDGEVKPFRAGVLLLLRRASAPVVPIAVDGAFDVWPTGRRYPRLGGRILVKAGHAIPGEELLAVTPDEALDRLRRTIDGMRRELRKGSEGT